MRNNWSRIRMLTLSVATALLFLALLYFMPVRTAEALPTVLYRINAGGPLLSAIDGGPDWEGDTLASPSPYVNVPESGNDTFSTSSTVTPTAGVPTSLFQSERFDNDATVEMSWSFLVSATTEVEIRLYLAEIFGGAASPGARVFDVEVEGTVPTSFDDIDPYVSAGGKAFVGSVVTTTATIGDGALDLTFSPAVQNPAIKGIEIVALAETPTPLLQANPSGLDFEGQLPGSSTPLSVSLTHFGVSGSSDITIGSVSVTGTHASDFTHDFSPTPPLSPGSQTAFEVTFSPSGAGPRVAALEIVHDGVNSPLTVPLEGVGLGPGAVMYRINVGGPAVNAADATLPQWSVDTNSTPSPYRTAGGGNTYSVSNSIVMTSSTLPPSVPAAVFQTERWDPVAGAEMLWSFPVSTSFPVEVRLYFAEIFNGIDASGERVFDVQVEGVTPTVFTDVDPFGLSGGLYTGIMLSHVTEVDGGALDLEFLRQVENPALKGIEIILADPGATAMTMNTVETETGAPGPSLWVFAALLSLTAFTLILRRRRT